MTADQTNTAFYDGKPSWCKLSGMRHLSRSVAGMIFNHSKDKPRQIFIPLLSGWYYNPSKWDRPSVERLIHHMDKYAQACHVLPHTSWPVKLLPSKVKIILFLLMFSSLRSFFFRLKIQTSRGKTLTQNYTQNTTKTYWKFLEFCGGHDVFMTELWFTVFVLSHPFRA